MSCAPQTEQSREINEPAGSPPRKAGWGTVLVICFGGLAASLMQTLVVPLLPRFPELLGISPSLASWLVTIALVSTAIATPVLSRLGDMFGKRRLLVISLGLLIAGSVLCALTSHWLVFLIGRAVQGAAFAAIPLGISMISAVVTPERVGQGIALMSATLGIGGALGLPFAGMVVQYADYHALFWVCAGMGCVAVTAVILAVPESTTRTPGRVDLVGMVLLGGLLGALLVPLSYGSTWGWANPATLGCFLAAIGLSVLFVRYELRHRNPLVNLYAVVKRPILLTNLASVLIGFAMMSNFIGVPAFLQAEPATGHGFGVSLLVAGLCMLPGGLLMVLIAPLAGRLITVRGPRLTLMLGAAIIGAGYLVWLLLRAELWGVALSAAVVSGGVAVAYGAMPALVLKTTPETEAAAATGINTLARSIGTSLGSATAGTLFAGITMTVAGTAVPATTAFVVLFVIGGLAALLAAVIAGFAGTGSQQSRLSPAAPVPAR
ncbi:MFS transporter [Tamaricihabitans halophyticus]|uniref:MFS transporter n=2 Tax=Tamaricihabitans halophyticus TaxID=1262583 RepID=A0A4R2QVA5_9PSEU|nr:MFS transporter [Tamaricihabitans halophyticus]